jgi:hypothetical protein
MFEPKDKRCYQKLAVLPALDNSSSNATRRRWSSSSPTLTSRSSFAGEKYKNRVAFLTAVDQTGIFNVNKKAQRLWAISQVVKDLTPDDSQYKKAKDTRPSTRRNCFWPSRPSSTSSTTR